MRLTIKNDAYTLEDLASIMARLRAPGGCPWDRDQTLQSLRSYLLEESYELLQALDGDDPDAHREELGDLLLQIVFQSQIASENGWFTIQDVVDGIARKLLRRHPHVFGDEQARTAQDVVVKWERVKNEEKRATSDAPRSVLDGVPAALPALLATHRLSERAARVGFDWENPRQVLGKLREEIDELNEAVESSSAAHIAWELGDLLFAVANLARHLDLCGEDLLREANRRFDLRFRAVERLARERGIDLGAAGIDSLEALWQEAKTLVNGT